MDEGPITHPGVPQDIYHTLGKKTLWMFVFQRMSATILLFILTIVLFILSGQQALTKTPFGDLTGYSLLGAEFCLLAFVLTGLVATLIGWLIYSHFKFSLGDDSLKIKRGVFLKEEVAIPYRQIQDVDIDRDLSFQMFGLSKLIILTAGHEDEKQGSEDESEGVLPAIDQDLAEWLQAELLKRANVQKVTETPEGK